MNKPIKKLTDFPYFTVTSIKVVGENWEVCGFFNKTAGVREERYWLVKEDEFYIADLIRFDKDRNTGVMEVTYWEDAKDILIGDKLYCVTAYWNWDFMSYIADKNSVWNKVNFIPVDAQVFLNNGVRGWCRVNRKLSEGCIPTGEIIKGGWDHEHCDLCDARIDNDAPVGYHDPKNLFWLCEPCYSKYAVNGDLSFTGE